MMEKVVLWTNHCSHHLHLPKIMKLKFMQMIMMLIYVSYHGYKKVCWLV
jgi:hypothetical protein